LGLYRNMYAKPLRLWPRYFSVRGVSPVVEDLVLVVIGVAVAVALFRFAMSVSEQGIVQGSSSDAFVQTKHEISLSASAVSVGSNAYQFCVFVRSQDQFAYHHPVLSITSAIGSLGSFTEFNGTCTGAFGPSPCSLCVTASATPSTYTLTLDCDECNPATTVVSAN